MINKSKWVYWLDKLLPRLTVVAMIVLLLTQIALFHDGTRQLVSLTERLEGQQLARVNHPNGNSVQTVLEPWSKLRLGKTVTFKTSEPQPQLSILINNQRLADLSSKTATVTVYEQDYIEIDGTQTTKPIRIQVTTAAGILLPMNNITVETNADLAAVGRVKFR